MNWALAIERNRAALVAVASAIAALVGGPDGMVARSLRNAALALLRPAEAAARRLIVIAARGVTASIPVPRPFPAGAFAAPVGRAAGERTPAFQLFDRPKRFRPMLRVVLPPRGEPRIRSFWSSPIVFAPPPPPPPPAPPFRTRPDPDDPVDSLRLRRRLRALQSALADLPRQAGRLARLRARRAAAPKVASGLAPRSPLRPGRPPGHRLRPDREVDHVLRECHALALDTS